MMPIVMPMIAQRARRRWPGRASAEAVHELVPHGDSRVVGEPEAGPAVLVSGDEVLDEDPVLLVPRLVEPELLSTAAIVSSVGDLPAKRRQGRPEAGRRR